MNALRILLLGAIWCILTRELSVVNLLIGLSISSLLVLGSGGGGRASAEHERGPRRRAIAAVWRRMLVRPLLALELAVFFLYELLVSNVRIALLVLRPRLELRPMIVAVPVDARSEEELAVLSDLVTLTPGTLCLDVSDDAGTMIVHVLAPGDPMEVRRNIREGLGRRVRRLFA